ncbi:hypothetical protein AAFF_G00309680 [Aldrovandia affinis]|uniref:Uncharacterized protein n=1 Tax=Aldrovandia affinis TaxID=143900 RepID=A0AAD7WR86_9TELE|nr:hypothetical protein AAFF_G00309680 [Aldrovandia affinis]
MEARVKQAFVLGWARSARRRCESGDSDQAGSGVLTYCPAAVELEKLISPAHLHSATGSDPNRCCFCSLIIGDLRPFEVELIEVRQGPDGCEPQGLDAHAGGAVGHIKAPRTPQRMAGLQSWLMCKQVSGSVGSIILPSEGPCDPGEAPSNDRLCLAKQRRKTSSPAPSSLALLESQVN